MIKGLLICLFQDLARPAGFEPTTPWFVARYSIQLSYGRSGEEAKLYQIIRRTSGNSSRHCHTTNCIYELHTTHCIPLASASRPSFKNLARPAGFEPTTPWFVARYSIQLSYGRVSKQALNNSVVSKTAQVARVCHAMPWRQNSDMRSRAGRFVQALCTCVCNEGSIYAGACGRIRWQCVNIRHARHTQTTGQTAMPRLKKKNPQQLALLRVFVFDPVRLDRRGVWRRRRDSNPRCSF